MLSFNLRELDQHALVVDGRLAADDPIWEPGDPVPTEPLHVTGRISRAGTGRYFWSGRIEADVGLSCRRCLGPAVSHLDEETQVLFAEEGDESADDPDVVSIPPHARELDLRPVVRELWLLAVPGFALCQDECKGLCARCGADLNEGPCECPPETDSRWAALRGLRDDID